MGKHHTATVEELAQILDMHRNGTREFFSHMSRLHRAAKSSAYRLMSKKGLIAKSPDNDRYEGTTVWFVTPKGQSVRQGEEFSALS